MKNIIVSMLSGAIGAGLVTAFVSSSYATTTHELAKDMLTSGSCNVELTYPTMSVGDRCFDNTVTVGIWNDNLYCSQIKVTCP